MFHLAWLAEELPDFVAAPSGAWLFRAMAREAELIAATAAAYVAEYERDQEVRVAPDDGAAEDADRPDAGRDAGREGGAGGAL